MLQRMAVGVGLGNRPDTWSALRPVACQHVAQLLKVVSNWLVIDHGDRCAAVLMRVCAVGVGAGVVMHGCDLVPSLVAGVYGRDQAQMIVLRGSPILDFL